MKHFDKILNYIFPVVDEDDEEVKKPVAPVAKPQPKPQPQVVVKPKPVVKPQVETEVEKMEVKVKPREEVILNNDHLSKSKSSFSIDIDKSFDEPKFEQPKTVVNKPSSPKKYVPKPAISPIFGVLEERKDPRIIDTPQYESEDEIKSASKIGTIFSPIYGVATAKKEADPFKFKEEALAQDKEDNEDSPVIETVTDVKANGDTLEQTSLMDMLDEIHTEPSIKKPSPVLPTFEEQPVDTVTNQECDLNSGSLEDILIKPKDETHIMSSNENISLFENETEER